MNLLKVGYGRKEAMPETIMALGGVGLVGREYTGVHDLLYITCLAISDEKNEPVLIYTMDTLKSERFIHPLRSAIAEATGIPEDRILLSSTHTHSAPAVYSSVVEGAVEYREVFRKAAIDAAREALADRTPAEFSVGTFQAAGMAFSRHYIYEDGVLGGAGKKNHGAIVGHADPADEQMQMIHIHRAGKKDILMLSFPVHGTFMSIENRTLISADVAGAVRSALEEKGDLLVAYFMGAAGNQAPQSKAPDNHGLSLREYGKKLASQIAEELPKVVPVKTGAIQMLWHNYIADANKEKVELYEEACEAINIYYQGGMDAVKPFLKEHGFTSYWETIAIKRRKDASDTVEVPLSVLRMGELSFALAPYEMFAENGQYIKENSPDSMTFMITCANGCVGYLPMERAYDYGVYEGDVTLVKRGTAEAVAQYYVDMIHTLKNDGI